MRCIHELPHDQCDYCQPKPDPVDPFDPFSGPTIPLLGPWFVAGFAGECSECGDEFDAGCMIRADGTGGYVSECGAPPL